MLSQERKYRAGIIGLGFIGKDAPDSHYQAYWENPRIEYVGGYDIDPHKTEYRTLDDLLAKRLDIVSICTPVATHYDMVCLVAPYVKAIYCEKPIALSVLEAESMIRTCHHYGAILQVNHQRRFMPPKFRFSRDIIDTGTHAFDRMRELFGEIDLITADEVDFVNGQVVDIEYIESQEHIFELDCVRSKERMIPYGLEHLIYCLEYGVESISSGEEATKTLEAVLRFKEAYETSRNR